MRRLRLNIATTVLVAAGLLGATPSDAQQAVSVYVGGLATPDWHGRESSDVLLNNLDFLSFDVRKFSGFTFGGEYLVGVGDYLEAGLGVGHYSQTVPSVYADYVNANRAEIRQDLSLRMTPFSATVRVLPFGRTAVQPYVGGGVAIINWRYRESGEFVDFTDRSVFRDTFTARGTAVGPTVLGGVRVPVGRAGVGFEVRWQDAKIGRAHV